MIDKIFAPLSLLMLAVFMAIIVYYVPKIELGIISAGCVGFAAYDFWRHFKGR